MFLQSKGIQIGLELSPPRFHGLTYRELGDFTPAVCLLMETANPIQGRLRGITDETLIHKGQDAFYLQAAKLKRTFVPFDKEGWPLKVRVGRHLAAMQEILVNFAEMEPEKAISIEKFFNFLTAFPCALVLWLTNNFDGKLRAVFSSF